MNCHVRSLASAAGALPRLKGPGWRDVSAAAAALAVALCVQVDASAQTTPIVIGQTTGSVGPAAAIAVAVSEGIRATFEAANRAGGINGRPLQLAVLEDGFEGERAAANAAKLIDEEGAVAIVGPSGAPATASLTKLSQEKRFALIGPTTGVPALRENVETRFYVRASYFDEIEYLTRQLSIIGMKRIALAYFDNQFGRDGIAIVQKYASAQGLEVVANVPISDQDAVIDQSAKTLATAAPQAVLLYSLVQPAAKFVRAYRKLGSSQFYSLSIASADTLHALAGEASEGVVVSEVVPSPQQRTHKVVANCAAALSATGKSELSRAHVEGCIIGSVTVEALRRLPARPTREDLLRVLNRSTFDLGGYRVQFSPDNRNGSKFVDMVMVSRSGRVIR